MLVEIRIGSKVWISQMICKIEGQDRVKFLKLSSYQTTAFAKE